MSTDHKDLIAVLRIMGMPRCREAADAIAALVAERDKLKTVMVAAAEEIDAHWEAHCDAEGYGPQNLMRRLEEGIASEYGYTAGAFAKLRAERDAAVAALRKIKAHVVGDRHPNWSNDGVTYASRLYIAEWCDHYAARQHTAQD